jgi:rubrerythrin
MKQTAVEFLAYELMNLDIAYEMGLEKNEFHKLRQEIIKKAKEMEKQQIVEAYQENMMSYTDGETYYNETFKNKKDEKDNNTDNNSNSRLHL